MAAINYTAGDYLGAFQSLMPRGRAWPRDPDATQTKVLAGLTPVYERNTARANNLLVDAFPATTVELLTEWEQTLGLPDPCAGPSPSTETRRAQVLARFANTGGQSSAYYVQYAANLGYSVTIQNHAPFRCGQSRCGHRLGTSDWMFAWTVSAPLNTVTRWRSGVSRVGEPLASWGNAVLQCEIQAVAPAHTYVNFVYQ